MLHISRFTIRVLYTTTATHHNGDRGKITQLRKTMRPGGRRPDQLREVRRILAETEPRPGYHLGLGPYPRNSRSSMQVALAEALAAFVAEE